MNLKFTEQQPLNRAFATCPQCGKEEHIGIHSYKERRYICYECNKTFSETNGTIFYQAHYPIWVILLTITLLANGCPLQAIVTAFYIDERTIANWQKKAGKFSKKVQEAVVCNGKVELGQVQADELCVNAQGKKKIWVATGMDVFSRLFLWGEVSTRRDKKLIERLMIGIRETASSTIAPILFAVDGFAAYPNAIIKIFHTKVYTGRRGRPRHITWPNLHIVQVVKSRTGYKLKGVARRLVHGCLNQAYEQIFSSQCGLGKINTAYIERLNATFRARMPVFVRRTRGLARTVARIETEMFLSGVAYNFCTVHTSLDATPAMAAGLTDHIWSMEELFRFRLPQNLLHDGL